MEMETFFGCTPPNNTFYPLFIFSPRMKHVSTVLLLCFTPQNFFTTHITGNSGHSHVTFFHLDIRCKPVARYVYNSARCWPCCGSLIHVVCMPPLCKVKRCPNCGMAFYLGTPQWEQHSSTTRYRVQFLRKTNGIPLTESLPQFPHTRKSLL